jgi:hypothetical protein
VPKHGKQAGHALWAKVKSAQGLENKSGQKLQIKCHQKLINKHY